VIADHVFLERPAFLIRYNGNGSAVEKSETAYYRRIVSKGPVAVQFYETVKNSFYVVKGVGPVGVAGKLNTPPDRLVFGARFYPVFQQFYFFAQIKAALSGGGFQFVKFCPYNFSIHVDP
jgi:hypothetical protein